VGPRRQRFVTTRAHDVFSSRLKKADWSNPSILEGDVATEAAKLKAQVGKDLVIYGHGLLGRGKLLFRDGKKTNFKLIAQKTLATGVIVASYQPVTP
jgi:hypothetical protein